MALDERVQLRRTVAGRELYAKVAERDSDGYNIAESFELINDKIPASASVNNKLATTSDLSGKQDTLSFDPNSQYDASNNPVATVGTVAAAVSSLSGCAVTYQNGELHLDFSASQT